MCLGRKVRFTTGAGVLGLAIGAGWAALATAGHPASDPGKVLSAVASPVLAIAHTPSFVGVEKGLFLKYGLDLKLKILGSGQEVVKALQAGELQFGAAAYSNYPIALERGLKTKLVVGVIGESRSSSNRRPAMRKSGTRPACPLLLSP